MPYYRITIIIRDRSEIKGVRFLDNSNIDAVTNIARAKAKQHYGDRNVIDVEAAMLSNHCSAVIEYREKQQRIRENKKYNSTLVHVASNRKNYKGQPVTLAERKQNENKRENNS